MITDNCRYSRSDLSSVRSRYPRPELNLLVKNPNIGRFTTLVKSLGGLRPFRMKENRPFTVVVEGNIGCGKTTFLDHFSKFSVRVKVLTSRIKRKRIEIEGQFEVSVEITIVTRSRNEE